MMERISAIVNRGKFTPKSLFSNQKCEKCNLELVQSSFSNKIVGLNSQVKGTWLIRLDYRG